MKRIKQFTSRMLAVMLAGTLAVGSLSVSAFGAEDAGSTAAAAEEFSLEEATENSAAEATATEEADREVMTESSSAEVVDGEGVSESPDAAFADTSQIAAEEEAVTSYTVTLDANGGYFANEWDDTLNESVERTEILNKVIPVGGTVTVFPVMEQENAAATFMGWSLEPDGELVSQANEEYIPVDNCTLFAVWQIDKTAEIEDAETPLPETNAEESVQNENTEEIQEENPIEFAAEGETAQEEYPQEQVIEEENTQTEDSLKPVVEDETAQEEYSQEQVMGEETTQEEESLEPAVEKESAHEENSLNEEASQEIDESPYADEETPGDDEGSEVTDGNPQDDQTVVSDEEGQQEIVSSNPVYTNLGDGTPEDFEVNSVPISLGEQYIGVSVKEGALYKFVSRENDTYTFSSECEYDTIGTLFGENGGDMFALALDDNSGNDNNFSTSYDLEEGKTYYLGVIFSDYESGSGTRAIMLNVTRENCTEHYPVEDSGVYTEPTCLEGGYCTYICRECGKKYKDDFTYPNGHSPLEDSGVVTEPTCSEKGYTTYTCNVCGEEYIDDYTDPIDHYPEEDSGVVTEPTCFEGGYTTYICSQCGEEYKDDYTDPIPHECDEDCKCIFCGMEYPYCIKNAESYTDEETGENYVTVDYRLDTIKNCEVFVEIYEEGNDYYSFSGYEYIHSKGENRINVNVKGYVYGLEELPEYYIIKAYLIDSSTVKIISNVYENYLHTKAFVDLLNSDPEDYEEERTIEFSEDNFGVFSENTVVLYGNADLNTIRDYSGGNYTIENVDEMAEKLKDGCELAYFYEDELKIIAHVLTVSSSKNNTIIIETEDTALEDVFDYLKVEDTVDISDCSVDTSNLPEGVTFAGDADDYGNESFSEDSVTSNALNGAVLDSENGIDESGTYEITAEDAKNAGYTGGTLRFDFKNVPFNDNAAVNGYITVGLSPSMRILIAESQSIYMIDMDFPVSMNISATGKVEGSLPLGTFWIPVLNGIFMINAHPKAFISFEGGISYSTTFSTTFVYDNKSGIKVLGSCNSDVNEIEQVFGSCRVGAEIETYIITGGCRFIYIPCKIGVVLSASFAKKIPEYEQEEGDHICQSCITGDICAFCSTEPQIVKIKNITLGKRYYELTAKITDFYHSFDYGDHGWGQCPHIRDEDGNDAGENGGDNEEDDEDEGGSYAFIAFDVATKKLICLGSGSLIIGDEFLIIPEKYYEEGGVPDYAFYDDMPELHNGKVAKFKKGDPEYQYIPWVYWGDAYYTSIQKLQKCGYSFDTVEISNNVTKIYYYDNWIKRISIPSSVISLFISNDFIESLSIPSSVKELYVNCDNLKTLTVPANVKSMEVGYCESLKTITISQGVESVYIHDNESLETISTPQGCKRVEIGYCSNLKKVEIAEGPNDIFIYWCPNVREIEMPNHAKNIDFTACESLEKIDIPEGVTIIDAYIFDGCKSLKHITIPNTVTRIESDAFPRCDLQSIVIPDSVRIIGDRAFESNNKLTSVVFPEGLKSIGDDAFRECYSLINVSFPSVLPDIGRNAFWGTPWAEALNDFYDPVFNGILLHTYRGNGHISISSNVRQIGNGVFSNISDLLSVAIPSSVTSVGREAFLGCSSLESIRIPSSVTNIGAKAFSECTNLKSIIIPSSVVSIGEHAFHYYVDRSDGRYDDLEEGYYPIQNLVIYGETGSYAEHYAKRNNIPFSEYNKKDITEATVTINSKTYTGNAVMPNPVVSFYGTTLQVNTDYTVSYYNNINAGTAYVEITGTGNFEGSITESFKISKATQSISVKASASSVEVGKTATITPSGNKGSVTFKSSNTNVATIDKTTGKITAKKVGSVIITAMAAETRNFKAASKTITITVTKGTQSITAKAAASSVAVGKTMTISTTGNKGTVTYKSSNTTIATVDKSTGKVVAKKVGAVTITVTSAATTNYKVANTTVKIKIVPAETTSFTAANQTTGIKLTWKKVTGANGYKVYRGSTLLKTITSGSTVTYTDTKANTNGTKYTYKIVAKGTTGDSTLSKSVTTYRVARPAVSSVTNSASRTMTVKWGKNAKANGYQIQYSTDKTFKTGNKALTITSASTVSKVIGSLTKGKTYYVRIQTYKTVGSTKYWSEWSAAKSVKISK